MDENLEKRVSKLEIDGAIIQEQLSQIMQQLATISGQLSTLNTTFVRRDLCEQAHKSYDREFYEFRHTIEKRIVESDGILAGEMQKMEKRIMEHIDRLDSSRQKDIDGIGKKLTSWTNRVWAIFLPVISAMAIYIVMSHINGGK